MRPYIILYTALALATTMPLQAQTRRQVPILDNKIKVENISTSHADNQLYVKMRLCLDSLRLSANQRIVLTPLIENDANSVALPPVVINSRRQKVMYDRKDSKLYPGAVTVARKAGKTQSVDYTATVDYADWMRQSDIVVREDLCGCGKVDEQQSELLKKMRQPKVAYIVPVAAEQKTYTMSGSAFIDFPVDRIELHPDYRNNPRELAKIIDTINVIKADPNMTIVSIDIHGYASPEAPYEHNEYLAANRARTLKNYVRQLVRLDDDVFSVSSTAEDWDGLCRYIRQSNLDAYHEILAIAADNSIEPDRREWLIKTKYPNQYSTMLATWYPALRHSDYIITCSVRPFSVEEAKQLLKTKPQLLSQNEMYLVAQSYEPGSKDFNEVFDIAAMMFPDDPTANLNAACTAINEGNFAEAMRKLEKAGSSAEADNARGICFWQLGNESQAIDCFKRAADSGCQAAKDNLEAVM